MSFILALLSFAGSGAQQARAEDRQLLLNPLLIAAQAEAIPGDATCAEVQSYPERRTQNEQANQTSGRPTDPTKEVWPASWRPYYERINGTCTGSTEQILEWAARKWGFDELGLTDLAKAMAVVESFWDQHHIGHNGAIGILQITPYAFPDWEPARWSTAYSADYTMAIVRSNYDGVSRHGSATLGRIRDSVAAWECGCSFAGQSAYAMKVFHHLQRKPWQHPGQPPDWF